MASKALNDRRIQWSQVRGRNGYDPPATLPDGMAAEVKNVAIRRGVLGPKRFGSSERTFTGDSFSGYNSIARFVPGQSEAAAEFHFVSQDGTPKIMRVAAGTAADELTLADAIDSLPQDARAVAGNGKLYWSYDSDENRLHVYDPNLSTSVVRRAGLPLPGAPSVGDTGSGSYPDVIRYYRVQWRVKDGSRVQRRSNLGTAQSFTPSGSGTDAQVTQPTPPGEGETHWVVFGSDDDADYYEISGEIAIGTTTYDDSDDPADYSVNTAAPVEGNYYPLPSAKFLLWTGERLLLFGAYESAAGSSLTPRNGRVWFTPVLDTTDDDDDERVQNTTTFKGWIDVSRDANAVDRALAGPLDGQIFAFQSRGVFMLVPTANAERPYRRVNMSTGDEAFGAVNQESTFMGEDEGGRACIYFLDPGRGLMRYGQNGFEWCGYDSQDLWARVNLDATVKVAHGVYDGQNKCVKMWLALDSDNEPSDMLVFYVKEGRSTGDEGVRFGHAYWDGDYATARCSAMFSETFGASMSSRLKPYAGGSQLLRGEDAAELDDNGTAFQGFITSKAFDLQPVHVKKKLGKSYLFSKAEAGSTDIQQSLTKNYGTDGSKTASVDIQAAASETRKLKRFQEAQLADAYTFQVTLGDASAVASYWFLDEWLATIEITQEEWGDNLT